jgi:hypothetical protein
MTLLESRSVPWCIIIFIHNPNQGRTFRESGNVTQERQQAHRVYDDDVYLKELRRQFLQQALEDGALLCAVLDRDVRSSS